MALKKRGTRATKTTVGVGGLTTVVNDDIVSHLYFVDALACSLASRQLVSE